MSNPRAELTKRARAAKPHPDTVRLDKLEALAIEYGRGSFLTMIWEGTKPIRELIDAAPEPRPRRKK